MKPTAGVSLAVCGSSELARPDVPVGVGDWEGVVWGAVVGAAVCGVVVGAALCGVGSGVVVGCAGEVVIGCDWGCD